MTVIRRRTSLATLAAGFAVLGAVAATALAGADTAPEQATTQAATATEYVILTVDP